MIRRLRRFAVSTRAATAVEFALILPVVLLLIGGVFEFSRVLLAQSMIRDIVDEAARTAILKDQDAGEVKNEVSAKLDDVPGITLTGDGVDVSSTDDSLVVSVTATVEMYMISIPLGNFTISNEYSR